MKKIIFFLSTLFVILLFVSGCGPSAVVVRERPMPTGYSHPLAPGPNYIWVSDEWIVRGGRYEYRKGYWVAARPGHLHYIGGHWQHKRRGWFWVRGYWRR
ncbi:MAG TPA: hypothetical protein VMU83_09215 [Hanamia sp.]|nr:hypothetical protein [Hanamia sp.]